MAHANRRIYLNVYAPSAPPPNGGRAVLAWIHGGTLQSGSAVYDFTDGSLFAAFQDVVVVTFNYRTNGELQTISSSIGVFRRADLT